MSNRTIGTISLFLIFIFISQINADCFTQVPTGFSANQFYIHPTNVTIDACDISNENSCCTYDLSRQIFSLTDTWTSGLLEFFSYSSTACRGAIQGISCLLCSAEQSSFIRFHSIYAQYYLCADYCQQVYSSCATSRVGTQTINEIYNSDSASFCYDLFGQLSNLNVQLVLDTTSTDHCWDDLQACTDESYYGEYTECSGGTRSLIFQKKPEANCNGGVPLPPTQTGLPCAVSCPPGQYTSIRGCSLCMIGHYSLGSAVREDSWQSWSSLEIPFTTYCKIQDRVITEVPCGWELGGFQINSGALNNSESSYLETSVVLIDNGTLAFDYTVDAEPRYDGLTVYVDREVVMPKVSTQFDYTLQVINLTAGYHFIQFVYSKDPTVSVGADRATLNLVQITPVNYAADSCTPCRAGRYQNSTGKSYCYDCPANTYSPEGAVRCTKCPPNYYSFEGSATCTPQAVCTENDAHYLYDTCYYSSGSLKQNQYPVWNLPHICYDSGNIIPPYPNVTADCVPCNPGEHRVGTSCVNCPNGYASETGESCDVCPSGTAAIKSLYLDHFDFWDQGLSSNCSYFCGSPGWDLHNDYIDSGSGHGRYVNSNLYLDVTLTVPGLIIFQYQLNCTQECALEFQFTNGTGGYYRGGPSITQNLSQQRYMVNTVGDVHFRWIFTKNDPDGSGRLDNAKIFYIAVANVEVGGAVNCTSCKDGTYSANNGQTTCTPCPPGTYSSSEGSVECTPCEDGYFNPDSGQSTCIPCGENTLSNDDHTDCVVTCIYDNNEHTYDLSPMARQDNEMYGPIYDFKNQVYFLNLCVREHNNNTCVDIDGDPIDTFACQVTTVGIGEDLGDIFGIIPLRDNDGEEGITVHLTHGENCKNTSNNNSLFPRQTYIDIICDPTAGVGSPTANSEDNVIETSKCVYEFTWRSLYGCHVCSEDDYTYILTACDNQNRRQIQYIWKDNPKACHDGVSLPDHVDLSCSNVDETYCPPGHYLDLAVSIPVCTPASPGFYSIGGALSYDTWTEGLPESFSSVGWTTSRSGYIRSGSGDTSLLYLKELVIDGSITIIYRIFGYGDSTGGFSVYINDNLVLGPLLSTTGIFHIKYLPVEKGHTFVKFQFVEGSFGDNSGSNGEGVGVEILSIEVKGTSYASEYQLPCPAGYYSEEAASACTLCPPNTYSDTTSAECITCPQGYYSYAGSYNCVEIPECTLDNYQLVYSECRDGQRDGSYIKLTPYVCTDIELPTVAPIACDKYPCPPGQYRDVNSDLCESCSSGYYYDSATSSCAKSKPGYAGILQSGWYTQPETSLPYEFSTECYFNCLDTWRSRSDYIDSGDNHRRQVDVLLKLTVDLKYDGSITFDYSVDGSVSSGLLFFVNDKQKNIPYHPTSLTSPSIPLENGTNVIAWTYHQESGDHALVQLSNIVVTGAGSSTSMIACPPGTYSSAEGSNTCTSCPPGSASSTSASTSCPLCSSNQFAEDEGSTSCSKCGDLTYSNDGHTDCVTDCQYQNPDDRLIDLTPLGSISGPFALTNTTKKLWLNLCAKQTSSVLCIDPDTGDSIKTYSCLVDDFGNGIDSGNLLSTTVVSNSSIRMFYANGATTNSCPHGVTTDLLVVCSPDNDNTEPYEITGSTECSLKLQWDISYGCYLCDSTDYENRTTDCTDGQQTSALIRLSPCFGPKVMGSGTVKCHVPFHVPIFIIIPIVIVIIALIVVVVAIFIWNRKLQQKYTALVMQKGSGNYEMNEIPESAVGEDDA